MWRIDELDGPPDALDRAADRYLDETACNESLDVPRSTVQHRLQRAEATVVEQFLEEA